MSDISINDACGGREGQMEYARWLWSMRKLCEDFVRNEIFESLEDQGDYVETINTLLSFAPMAHPDAHREMHKEVYGFYIMGGRNNA
jgi:hypothetical protein